MMTTYGARHPTNKRSDKQRERCEKCEWRCGPPGLFRSRRLL